MLSGGLLLLAVGMTAYLTAVMRYRTRRIVERAGYMRVFRVEMALCACMVALAVDACFGLESVLRLKLIVWAVRFGALVVLVPSFALAALIASHLHDVPAGEAENVIVPGLALENGRPTWELKERLEAAWDYAQNHPTASIIVTGGNGGGGAFSEAAVMREVLLSKGVDEAHIRLEDRSTDTIENFENVARMVDTAAPVLVVTSGYHMLRAAGLARASGFRTVLHISARCDPLLLPANIVWETICLANCLVVRRVSMDCLCI